MKYFSVLLGVNIIFSSLFGYAQEIVNDDCTLNFDQFQSLLKVSPDLKLMPEERDSNKKILSQSAVLNYKIVNLKDGKDIIEQVKVNFEGGGCSHLAFSLTISDFKAPRLNHRFTKKYLALMSDFVVNSLREPESSILIKSLDKVKNLTHPHVRIPKYKVRTIDLDCGPDAQCKLELISPQLMKISYDFAL